MNKAAKIVSSAIIGADFEVVEVNGKGYIIKPPTIKRISGAIARLSHLALPDGATLRDIFKSQEHSEEYAYALSYLIQGDYSLAEELSEGTYDEIIEGLLKAFDMLSAKSFSIAVSLTRSASALAASPLRW